MAIYLRQSLFSLRHTNLNILKANQICYHNALRAAAGKTLLLLQQQSGRIRFVKDLNFCLAIRQEVSGDIHFHNYKYSVFCERSAKVFPSFSLYNQIFDTGAVYNKYLACVTMDDVMHLMG